MRDRELPLCYAPVGVRCPGCGPRVEQLPWVDWKTVAAAVKSTAAWGPERRRWKPLHICAYGFPRPDTYTPVNRHGRGNLPLP